MWGIISNIYNTLWIILILFIIYLFWSWWRELKSSPTPSVGKIVSDISSSIRRHASPLEYREAYVANEHVVTRPVVNVADEQVVARPVVNVAPVKGKWKMESLCCDIMDDIYQTRFQRNVRPTWLRNPETGHSLELDCYSPELKIALEYNGEQHYNFPNRWHSTEAEFRKQVRHDIYKVNICDLHGVYLITVPYNVPRNQLRQYIEYYLPENVQARSV